MNFITNIFRSAKKTISAAQRWLDFAKMVKPSASFDALGTPDPLDYSTLDAWAAHPKKSSKALLTPPGETVAIDPKVDVFYVHPTTYFGKHSWNQSADHQPSNALVEEMIMGAQASVFNGSCRIYAPKYRQATFYVFLAADENSEKGLNLAYTDVKRAFEYYLKNENNGRPFILASHSQGSAHLPRLLADIVDPSEELTKKMVAAYSIGFQFPIDKFQRTLKNIKPSSSPTDLHSVIAWDTFGQGANPKSPIDRTRHFYKDSGKWEMRYKKKNFGVNPISFSDKIAAANAEQHLGGVIIQYEKPLPYGSWWSSDRLDVNAVGLSAPFKNEVSAELKNDRFVYISEPKNRNFKLALLPGKNYHNYDYSLFYMNFRKNIAERVAAYLEQY